MRTTLKRGIGRGAAVGNGNGRPVLPPDALSAISRYRQPPPPHPRLGRAGRFLSRLLGGLLIVVLGMGGGLYLWLHDEIGGATAKSPGVRAAQRHDLLPPVPGQPAVALIVGYDHRAGSEKDSPPRSDTVMLVRADPVTKSLSMLSFPRDLVTDIYCPGRPVTRDRINVAYTACGVRGTLNTVKALTGVPVNYLITVNFRGFKKVVQRVGGVWIDVDRRYFNDNSGAIKGVNNYAAIDLPPGYQRLNGGQALDYVRFRHTDSDIYRNARQQQFVRAFKQQATRALAGTNLIFTLPKLVHAILSSVEVGVGGGKQINLNTVKGYALFLHDLPSGHLFQSRIQGLTGYAELSTDPSNLQAAVRDFLTPDVEAPKKATQVALGIKPKKAPLPTPQETPITVLNGNGVPGSATDAGYLLGQRGYRIVLPPTGKPANAPTWDYFRSRIYYDRTRPAARRLARRVADLFGSADVGWTPPAVAPLANGATLVVVVGKTFHGSLGPAPVDQTPKAEPPRVAANRAGTADLLRGARARIPFPLESPALIEQTSYADREMPLRVYKITRGHKAVRLTFRTGGGEYWGIEETSWADAPILDGRSFRKHLKGRTFDLFYSGPHLHMVVLREGGATYWVVNTLLDTLSNETMLSIAESLRPLDAGRQ